MKVLYWLKKEFLRVLPAFLFFLATFYLLNLTEGLMLKKEHIPNYSFWIILLAALVVAKVVIIVDHLPFIDLFAKRPLIYSIIWKTFLYGVVSFIIRIILVFFRLHQEVETLHETWTSLGHTLDPLKFIAIQIWYTFLFFFYITLKEFAETIGLTQTRKLFLGL